MGADRRLARPAAPPRWPALAWLLAAGAGCLAYAWTRAVRDAQSAHPQWTLVLALTIVVGAAIAAAATREPPMSIPKRSWLIGIAGMFAGSALFALDTAVEVLHLGPADLHYWIESAEFTIIGPGLGVLCLLLVERLRATRAAAQVREIEERERRFLMLGRMAAAVAHEVRNPLHTLRLVVDELRVEQPALRSHPLSAHIDDSLERIDRAVDLVYRLARPGAEDEGAGDLAAAVRAALAALALDPSGPVIRPGAIPDHAPVRCSASGLRIMIDNLLRNALQATASGDAISVELRGEPERWLLRVVNPGSLPALGAPRGGETGISSKPDGLGLGLVITRQIAGNAGGELTLAAAAGRVTAELALPVWKAPAP
jgi:signal transduction histidine kinase